MCHNSHIFHFDSCWFCISFFFLSVYLSIYLSVYIPSHNSGTWKWLSPVISIQMHSPSSFVVMPTSMKLKNNGETWPWGGTSHWPVSPTSGIPHPLSVGTVPCSCGRERNSCPLPILQTRLSPPEPQALLVVERVSRAVEHHFTPLLFPSSCYSQHNEEV